MAFAFPLALFLSMAAADWRTARSVGCCRDVVGALVHRPLQRTGLARWAPRAARRCCGSRVGAGHRGACFAPSRPVRPSCVWPWPVRPTWSRRGLRHDLERDHPQRPARATGRQIEMIRLPTGPLLGNVRAGFHGRRLGRVGRHLDRRRDLPRWLHCDGLALPRFWAYRSTTAQATEVGDGLGHHAIVSGILSRILQGPDRGDPRGPASLSGPLAVVAAGIVELAAWTGRCRASP